MYAFKCDRCGRLYEASDNYQGQNFKYKLVKYAVCDKLDLCPDCMSSLQKWMDLADSEGVIASGPTVRFKG